MSQSSISDITITDQGRFSLAVPAVGTSQSSMSSVTGHSPSPNGTQATLVPDSNEQVVLQIPALPMVVEARRRSRSPNSRSSPLHTPPRSKSPRHVGTPDEQLGSGRLDSGPVRPMPTTITQPSLGNGENVDREVPIASAFEGSQVPNGRGPTISQAPPARPKAHAPSLPPTVTQLTSSASGTIDHHRKSVSSLVGDAARALLGAPTASPLRHANEVTPPSAQLEVTVETRHAGPRGPSEGGNSQNTLRLLAERRVARAHHEALPTSVPTPSTYADLKAELEE